MIQDLWNWVSDFGITEKTHSDKDFIRFYNRMLVISVAFSVLVFIVALFFNVSFFYYGIVLTIFSFYASGLYLSYIGKVDWVRIGMSIFTPLWVSLSHIFLGGFFSQSLIILASLVITYVSFTNRPKVRNITLLTMSGFYIFCLVYETMFGAIYGEMDFVFDEIVLFVVGTAWTLGLVAIYKSQKNSLIAELKEKNIQLKEKTKELERFTYIASHDLKSPLRTMNTFLNLIELDIRMKDYEDIEGKLQYAKTSAQQMKFMIEGVLELSKISDITNSEKTTIDLNVVLDKAKMNLLGHIKERGAIIQSMHLPNFYCNEVEFLLLFQNFIQNGIKYNQSSTPTIRITTRQDQNELVLCFEDNGIGIDEKYHEQIFQFFKRLHNSSEYQGTGLGLGLCKKIIDAYHGTIEVDSIIGKGTTFRLTFPIKTDHKVGVFKKADLNSINKNPKLFNKELSDIQKNKNKA